MTQCVNMRQSICPHFYAAEFGFLSGQWAKFCAISCRMNQELLGPLKNLLGIWEGSHGDDTAPSDDRGTEKNYFRERMVFELLNPVQNHEQTLYGLRYKTTAWRINESDPFHEELGYWLWDPKAKQVIRSFLVPRGVSVLAGGSVLENVKEFTLSASCGSKTYGICSNLFLDEEFKTESYLFNLKFLSDTEFEYEEDTVIRIKGKSDLFHHIDKNKLKKIS